MMNIRELEIELQRVAKKEGLPFDENNILLASYGDGVYPVALVSVSWNRAFNCFMLVFGD